MSIKKSVVGLLAASLLTISLAPSAHAATSISTIVPDRKSVV